MSYAVIIPTMGRNTLDSAIDSVFEQTLPPSEVIVVAGNEPIISTENRSRVRIIEKGLDDRTWWNAAHNRNLGVLHASSEYVALLDDDDLWLPNKMEVQIDFLASHPNHVSICSAIYRFNNGKQLLRPKKILKENDEVLEVLYASKRFRRFPYYLPTPGTVLRREVALSIPQDETLKTFEDIWWFYELQAKGFTITQSAQVLVTVNAAPMRSLSRDSFEKNILWAKRLSKVSRKYGKNYLIGCCFRNALASRHWSDAIRYLLVWRKLNL